MVAGFIAVCWIIFFAYWLTAAFVAKATAERQSWRGILANRTPIWIGCFFFFWPRFPRPLSIQLISDSRLAGQLGAVICVLGLIGAVWSRKTLGRNWSSNVTFKLGHELVQQGPYRWVRHPIYSGLLLMFLGTGLLRDRLSFVVGFMFFFSGLWIKLRQEERLLMKHFPEYASYESRVKALVPFVL
jgi:protein-S-isoprenylcysteine O-methyltransferase Ste14